MALTRQTKLYMWEKAPAIVTLLAWLALYFFELTTGRLQRAGFAHQQVMALR